MCLSSQNDKAATFNIANGDVAGLKTAITTANSNGQDDTIELAAGGGYTLTAGAGQAGLTAIGADSGHKLIINGNGAIIQRSTAGGTPNFRLFYVNSGADLTVSNATLSHGHLVAHGGAFYVDGESGPARLTLLSSNISFNDGDYGGAIYNDGYGGSATLLIANCTFQQNFSINNGGAIFNDGGGLGSATLTIINSTFLQNFNTHNGGGTIQHDGFGGSVTGRIINSTFNQNTSAGDGGCIYIDGESDGSAGSAVLNVSECTFSNNSATTGGAIFVSGGGGGTALLQLDNSILETGMTGVNLAVGGGTITSLGYNLSNDPAGGDATTGPGGFLNQATDRRNTNPLTDPAGVKNNGGPTMTLALRASSPAIDQGKSDPLAKSSNDQRNQERPFDDPNIPNAVGGDGSDIGAYEADVRVLSEMRSGVGGMDLQFVFTSILDHNYEVQSRPDLASSTWTTVPTSSPPPPIAGTGGIIQVAVPNAIGSGKGFYRANQLP